VATPDYEEILESEGLGSGFKWRRPRVRDLDRRIVNMSPAETWEAWSAWARQIAETYEFPTDKSKRIWEMYASGATFADIAKAEGISRAEVYQYTDRVKRRCPPPPVRHPHRKSGGDSRIADYDRLRDAVAANPELLKLQGDRMAQGQQRKPVTYTRVTFMRDLRIPGVTVNKEFLLNVDGTPHAGGIDLEVEGRDKDHNPVPMIITVPWAAIRQAERMATDG
jgi:hypothetical protein